MEPASYPLVACPDAAQSAPAVLASVACFHGLAVSLREIRALTRDAGDGFDLAWVLIAARLLGFESLPLSGEYDQLPEVERPNILLLGGPGGAQRFVVLYEIDPDSAVIGDPILGRVERRTRDQLVAEWTGDCISVAPRPAELSRTRGQLARLGEPLAWLKEALDPARAGARGAVFAAAFLAVGLVLALGARSRDFASWIGLCALGVAALSSLGLALFGASCRSCNAASRLAGVLPLDRLGSAFYALAFAAAARPGREPILAQALLLASGVHVALLWLLVRARAACPGCVLAAGAAFVAAAAFSVVAGGVSGLEVLGALACAAATFAALPVARRLAAVLGDREARRLARAVAEESAAAPGAVQVRVWKRHRCPSCLYYESILRPGLSEEFGEAVTLDDRQAEQAWLPVPLIVVSGALTIVFKGLPPEDDEGDRYQALSRAVLAAQDPRLVPLGQLGGLLLVESRGSR
jgi:peptidase C39-like protein